jgi:uncharacterized protein (DUF433 family)
VQTVGFLIWLARSTDWGLSHHAMNDQIVIDAGVCHGKPTIRGTRMPVSIVIGSLAGGMGFEEVEREYSLTRAQIRSALKYAGELVDQNKHHPLTQPAS